MLKRSAATGGRLVIGLKLKSPPRNAVSEDVTLLEITRDID
jgi:hypothetical protein